MSLCPEYDYAASVQQTPAGPEWLDRPDRCHIAADVMSDPEAAHFISASYDITAGCSESVLHADIRANEETR